MAFIPTPNACLAVAHYGVTQETWTNGIWATKTNFTAQDQQQLADVVSQYWGAALLGHMDSTVEYDETIVYDMRTQNGGLTQSNVGNGVGLVTGELLPVNLAIVLTLYTANRGRSGRGRLYITGYPESLIADGAWHTDAINGVLTAAGILQTQLTAIGWTWSVVSKYSNGSPRLQGFPQPVTSYTVRSTKPGTQRRRIDRP